MESGYTYLHVDFFLEHKDRSLALRDKLELIPMKVRLIREKCVPATTAWHVWLPT